VTCAKNIEPRIRNNRFDKYLQRSAAHQSCIVIGTLIKVGSESPGFLVAHHFHGTLAHIRFNASSSHGADNGTVIANKHLGSHDRRAR